MAAIKPFYQWIDINLSDFTKEELLLLEAEFFIHLCAELKEFFRQQYLEYFRLLKFNHIEGDNMLEENFLRFILVDILSTDNYTTLGVAQYSNTHEDVIQEVVDGRNTNPSAALLRKIIDLHRSVRHELYSAILNKFLKKVA
jgi:hypothetical protein